MAFDYLPDTFDMLDGPDRGLFTVVSLIYSLASNCYVGGTFISEQFTLAPI